MTEFAKPIRNHNQVLVDNPSAAHPLIYADQLSAMAIGAFTSRITVAIEHHATSERVPVVTLVMPTATLHQLVLQVLAELTSDLVKTTIGNAYKAYLDGVQPVADQTDPAP